MDGIHTPWRSQGSLERQRGPSSEAARSKSCAAGLHATVRDFSQGSERKAGALLHFDSTIKPELTLCSENILGPNFLPDKTPTTIDQGALAQ
jgi:hypothetical protein